MGPSVTLHPVLTVNVRCLRALYVCFEYDVHVCCRCCHARLRHVSQGCNSGCSCRDTSSNPGSVNSHRETPASSSITSKPVTPSQSQRGALGSVGAPRVLGDSFGGSALGTEAHPKHQNVPNKKTPRPRKAPAGQVQLPSGALEFPWPTLASRSLPTLRWCRSRSRWHRNRWQTTKTSLEPQRVCRY